MNKMKMLIFLSYNYFLRTIVEYTFGVFEMKLFLETMKSKREKSDNEDSALPFGSVRNLKGIESQSVGTKWKKISYKKDKPKSFKSLCDAINYILHSDVKPSSSMIDRRSRALRKQQEAKDVLVTEK